MSFIGFVKEHNDVDWAVSLEQFIKHSPPCEDSTLLKVIDYLKQGIPVLDWMGNIHDLSNGSVLASDSYYSDGKYVWPGYYPVYLERISNFDIDSEFLDHLLKNKFSRKQLPLEDINRIEDYLSEIF